MRGEGASTSIVAGPWVEASVIPRGTGSGPATTRVKLPGGTTARGQRIAERSPSTLGTVITMIHTSSQNDW
jgi:hypothetical protein